MALTGQLSKMPAEARRPFTWDQGKEMAENVRFTVDTNIDVLTRMASGSGAASRTATAPPVPPEERRPKH